MMIIATIYLTGFVIAYYLLRWDARRTYARKYWDWSDVGMCALFSLTSWVIVVGILLQAAGRAIFRKLTNGKPNPPSWL